MPFNQKICHRLSNSLWQFPNKLEKQEVRHCFQVILRSNRAMSQAASEVTWIVRLLEELGVSSLKSVTLYCDNQSIIPIGKNPFFHKRTKHIEIDCHFTRDKVLEGLLQLSYMPTSEQLADILTKILPSPQQNLILSKLGMVSHPSSLRGVMRIEEVS